MAEANQAAAPAGGGSGGGESKEKPLWEEIMSSAGLSKPLEYIKKYMEEGLTGVVTMAGLALVGAAAVKFKEILAPLIAENAKKLSRSVQGLVLGRDADGERRMLQREEGRLLPTRVSRRSVEEAEQQAAAAAELESGAAATAGSHPDPHVLAEVRDRLGEVTPKLADFNRELRNTPKPAELKKTASGIEKISKAVNGLNTAKVAEAARTTGKLTGAVKHYDPTKLPKARDLKLSAQAAERLDRAGQTLAGRFAALKRDANELAAAMG